MTVRVVTDSTSSIDRATAAALDITVVPQSVHFGTRAFEDGVTITPDEFYEMLPHCAELPTTSQASPGRFKDVYDELGRDSDEIVSIHISSQISGTWNSALQGASESSSDRPIEVIDSRQASMGLGLVVLAAADAARRGADQEEVVSRARSAASRAQCMCLLETLEYLQKGGENRRGAGADGFSAENQAHDHRTGRSGASSGKGQDLPESPCQAEGGRTGIRANRVSGRFVQHHTRCCP